MKFKARETLAFEPLRQWREYTETLSTSVGYRENLVLHTQQFILWLAAKIGLRWKSDGSWVKSQWHPEPSKTLASVLFDRKQLYVERYLITRASEVSPQSLRSVCTSIKKAYEFWANQGLTKISPEKITNPSGYFGQRIAIVEAWLDDEKFAPGVKNTRRHDLRKFMRHVVKCSGVKSHVHVRLERILFEELEEHRTFDHSQRICGTGRFRGTLTAELLLHGEEHVRAFLEQIQSEPHATVLTIRNFVSTIKNFYSWTNRQGFSSLDPGNIVNPLSGVTRISIRLRATRTALPPPPMKSPAPVRANGKASRVVVEPTILRRNLHFVPDAGEILRLRDRIISDLLRIGVRLAEVCALRRSHFDDKLERVRIPSAHKTLREVPIPDAVGEQLSEYFAFSQEEPAVLNASRRSEAGMYAFPSLDGGKLLVDDSRETIPVSSTFFSLRNVAVETFVQNIKWGFGLARGLKVAHFRNSFSELCIPHKGGVLQETLPDSVRDANREYLKFVRQTPLKLSWTSDPNIASFYMAADGLSLTADDVV